MYGKRHHRIVYALGIIVLVLVVWHILTLPDSTNMENDTFGRDEGIIWKNVQQGHIGNNEPPSEYDRNNGFMQHCEDDVIYREPKLRIVPNHMTQDELDEATSINCTLGRMMSEGMMFPICLYDIRNDSSISGMLLHGKKLFEEENVRSIAEWLKQLKDAAFIDIGANIGLYTNMAAQFGYRVLAVEPRPQNVLRIRKALHTRNLQNKVTIVQNAVSDIRSRMNLLTHKTEQGRTIVVCDKDCKGSGSERCLTNKVETILMDDLLYATNITKAVMKIDIEGHEIKAFASSQYFFQKIDIPVILMEWDWRSRFQSRYNKDRDTVQDFMKMLMKRHYRPQDSRGGLLKPDKWDTWPVDVYWVLYNALE